MSIVKAGRRMLRKLIFGDTLLPHGVTLGLAEPQAEIAVWLEGLGAPVDVTERISMACAAPFTLCMAFDEEQNPDRREIRRLRLKFCERGGRKRVLGELSLSPSERVLLGGVTVHLFRVRQTKDHCLPRARLWAHDLLRACRNWRRTDASALKMSLKGMRAMTVMFIRPHPVVLVSHAQDGGNIFPMNLMGDLGCGYFAFALVDSRAAALGVERAGAVALSSVPFAQALLAFQLAPNHFRASADWKSLSFVTRTSTAFGIPVPGFARRVRELKIVYAQTLGSHRFFVAKIVRDDGPSAECETLHLIDGIYQSWRVRDRRAERESSLATDAMNKRGVYSG